LNKVWNEIASQLYQQAGQQTAEQQQTPGGGEKPKEEKENVQDASYEVVDDNDNKENKDKE
jgi:hypothetical protein